MKRIVAALAALIAASTMSFAADRHANDSLQITIMWPGDSEADVDLKVMAPGEPEAIEFRNKVGRHIRIVRDDVVDPAAPHAPVYFETAMADSMRPGEYIVNVVGFRIPSPTTVTLVVDRITENGFARRILVTKIDISRGEEKTIARFVLKDDGGVEDGSADQNYRPIGRQLFPAPKETNIWTRKW